MSDDRDAGLPPLSVAEKVAAILARSEVDSVLIGAAALAAHRYPRSTADIDLAVGMEPRRLGEIAQELRREGFTVEVSEPDSIDPLGGVIRASIEGADPIEIVNFCNPPGSGFPALIEIALRDATVVRPGAMLRVVTLPHLILFKLYAGGSKSKSDVLELLSRNLDRVDIAALRDACRRFRMDRRFDAWLRELNQPDD